MTADKLTPLQRRILQSFETVPLARALNWTPEQAANLDAFRVHLIDRLTRAATPE